MMEFEPTSPSKLSLLIADDSVIVCRRLKRLLEPLKRLRIEGEAHTAPEAFAFISEHRPDVVILDIQMPGGGGLSVLNKTKAAFPSTTVIIFTNFPSPQFRRRYLEAGADFFLDKSTEFEMLVELLDRLTRMEPTLMPR